MLISSCLISLCHSHKTISDSNLGKRSRLTLRFAAAIVILLLPLVHPGDFSSSSLVATTCGVTICAFITNLYGLTRKDDLFWCGGFSHSEKKATRYAVRFTLDKKGRQEIKKGMKLGHRITIKDLLHPSRRSSFDIDVVLAAYDHHSPHIHSAVWWPDQYQ